MKSPLFFVKLSLAFFPLMGVQPIWAQKMLDSSAGTPLPYSLPWSEYRLGRSAALSSMSITAASDCKKQRVADVDRYPSHWTRFMQNTPDCAAVPGQHHFSTVQSSGVPAMAQNHAAEGFKTIGDQGLRRSSGSLVGTAPALEPERSKLLSLSTIKLVLMGAALALLVMGVGHKTLGRW
ncbi:hypothetical protein HS961_04800 [Comamonas piscis]|uniref:Uncharacterized protein n=1 Tax=Comamonas piscis TaxID=1562974 RepID=A0A7G5EDX3_9BURK|nr:hypothetical protein [Comamonas piscis]QMV72198.1 hypothetical protein HS961_04800 [Comamonas piscis]WSO34959.1 hypothetical protein VUJ63_04825 [Comamonas piscis]